MYHDELTDLFQKAIELTEKLKKQDNGFVEEYNKSSKKNAKLTQQVNRLRTERDSLRKHLEQSSCKIQDHEQKIYELNVMLDNTTAAVSSLTAALSIKEGE